MPHAFGSESLLMDGKRDDSGFCFERRIGAAMIDYNRHLNVAWYAKLFDEASEIGLDACGLGRSYRIATDRTLFVKENHTHFRKEVLEGETVHLTWRLDGVSTAALHGYQFLTARNGSEASAVQEFLYIHYDLAKKRVTPFGTDQLTRLLALRARHAALQADQHRITAIRFRECLPLHPSEE